MKAADVIARDHRAAKELYETFLAAPEDEKKGIEHKLFAALAAHELMEDMHFYPALSEEIKNNDNLDQLKHEQTTLKVDAMGTHIKETVVGPNEESVGQVMHKVFTHAQLEEELIFPLAEEAFTTEELEELGEKMEPMSAVALTDKK